MMIKTRYKNYLNLSHFQPVFVLLQTENAYILYFLSELMNKVYKLAM